MSFEDWVRTELGQIKEALRRQTEESKSINELELTENTSNLYAHVYDGNINKSAKALMLNSNQLSRYQLKEEKDNPDGYPGLDENAKIIESVVPNLPMNRIIGLVAELAKFYEKEQVDQNIERAKNDVISILLDNPDEEINSIKELLDLINKNKQDISTKVSFTTSQNLTESQQLIARNNIGIEDSNGLGGFYEEGVFQPYLRNLNAVYNGVLTGHYVRIGNKVYINIKATNITDPSDISGNLKFSHLPFSNNGYMDASFKINVFQNSSKSIDGYSARISGKGIVFLKINDDSQQLSDVSFNNGAIRISGTYITNSYSN